MGLLDNKEQVIRENYIEVWKLIEILSNYNTYHKIGVYLGNINAHTKILSLYKLNDYYQIKSVISDIGSKYSDIEYIINCLIYDTNGTNEEIKVTLDKICLKSTNYYWKKSDLIKFQELKDILTPTQIIGVSSIDEKSGGINPEPIEKHLSYWNNKILPEIKKAKKISLFDLISLISNKYLKGTKFISNFIFCYMYVPDGFLSEEQEENISNIIDSLDNPKDVDKDNPTVNIILKNFDIGTDFDKRDYELLHLTIFDTKVLSDLFLSQDKDIQYFESTILFKLPNQQQDQLLTENEELKNTIINQNITIEKLKKSLDEIHEKNSGLEYINHGLGNSIMWLESEKSDLEMKIKELETGMSIHPAFDSGNKNYAPELLLAIQAWESKYISNEYPHQDHTPAIKAILTKKGLTNVRLLDRIAAITNPNKK